MSAPNVRNADGSLKSPFEIEQQIDAALNGKWGKSRRAKRRQLASEQLAALLPKLAAAEAVMRRKFNQWDRMRTRVARLEAELDRLERESFDDKRDDRDHEAQESLYARDDVP